MDLSDVITPEAILPSLKANSKKQALQAIAEKAAAMTGVAERDSWFRAEVGLNDLIDPHERGPLGPAFDAG